MPSKTLVLSMIVIVSALVLGACTIGQSTALPAADDTATQAAPAAGGAVGDEPTELPPYSGEGMTINDGAAASPATTDIYNAPTQPAGVVPGI